MNEVTIIDSPIITTFKDLPCGGMYRLGCNPVRMKISETHYVDLSEGKVWSCIHDCLEVYPINSVTIKRVTS